MSFIIGAVTGGILGKVARVYLVSMIFVFLTFFLSKIIGAPGRVLFTFSFYLMVIEIFGVPIATLIVASFVLNVVMPFFVLPAIEFFVDFMIAGFNLVTFSFLEDVIQNPFRRIWMWWPSKGIDVQPLVTMLLDTITAVKEGLDSI